MSIFDKFDKEIDLDGLRRDVQDAEKGGNSGNYEPIPAGTYEVSLTHIELKESKTGKPMVAMRFKILEGRYKNQLIFVNQVISSGFGIHKCNQLLKAMCQYVSTVNVEFESYTQYNMLLLDIFQAVNEKYSFALKQTPNEKNKDFMDFEITEVFEEDIPF
jgi:hypothetical protein